MEKASRNGCTKEERAHLVHLAPQAVAILTELKKLTSSDMLLSTLCRYVEAMGGRLELVAKFPDRPPVVIDHLADETSARRASAPVKAHA